MSHRDDKGAAKGWKLAYRTTVFNRRPDATQLYTKHLEFEPNFVGQTFRYIVDVTRLA